jgi:hypothetical protein
MKVLPFYAWQLQKELDFLFDIVSRNVMILTTSGISQYIYVGPSIGILIIHNFYHCIMMAHLLSWLLPIHFQMWPVLRIKWMTDMVATWKTLKVSFLFLYNLHDWNQHKLSALMVYLVDLVQWEEQFPLLIHKKGSWLQLPWTFFSI